jgi:hypothetical protein
VNQPKTLSIVFDLPPKAGNLELPRCGRSRLLNPKEFEGKRNLPPLEIRKHRKPATAVGSTQSKQDGGKPNRGRIQRRMPAKPRLLNDPAPTPEVSSQHDFPPLPTPAGPRLEVPGLPKIPKIETLTSPRQCVATTLADLSAPPPENKIRKTKLRRKGDGVGHVGRQ